MSATQDPADGAKRSTIKLSEDTQGKLVEIEENIEVEEAAEALSGL